MKKKRKKPKPSSLTTSLRKEAGRAKKSREPLWKGPEVDGVTQSLLGKFLVCRERFRLYVIEGLRPADEFNQSIEYGSMWHECEEHYDRKSDWEMALKVYAKKLCKRYPLAQEKILHWYEICKIQFPIYVRWWKEHGSKKKTVSLLWEYTFKVPYELPSGRIVLLRGKMDGVELVGSGRNARVWLKEHKTKGDINEELMHRQMTFDLQTMFYLVALDNYVHTMRPEDADVSQGGFIDIGDRLDIHGLVEGVIYNVVRRPLAGGKGSIRQHKPTKTNPTGESSEHFYGRVAAIIEEDPQRFFMRWDVTVSQADLEKFKREFLNPVLEQLCDWWEWIKMDPLDPWTGGKNNIHWREPYGIYNPMALGRASELDAFLATGDSVGLERTETLFGELE